MKIRHFIDVLVHVYKPNPILIHFIILCYFLCLDTRKCVFTYFIGVNVNRIEMIRCIILYALSLSFFLSRYRIDVNAIQFHSCTRILLLFCYKQTIVCHHPISVFLVLRLRHTYTTVWCILNATYSNIRLTVYVDQNYFENFEWIISYGSIQMNRIRLFWWNKWKFLFCDKYAIASG